MNSPVVALLLTVATVALALAAFVIYGTYFSGVQSSTISQMSVIALSKHLQIQISSYASYYNTTGQYFNVSYLVWIQVPAKSVVVVPFVAKPMNLSEPYYYLPSKPQNASLFYSTLNGYVPLRPFAFSGQVYLPQGDQLLGSVDVIGYKVSPNGTYVLNARLYPGEIIMIWILYYQSQWFRIGYTYVDPFSQGLGVYLVSGTGTYANMSKISLDSSYAPPYFTSEVGFGFGLWFEPILNSSVPATILNISFVSTSKQNVSFVAYQYDGKLYLETVLLSQPYRVTKTLFYNLTLGKWYFLNVSYGYIIGSTEYFDVALYNESGTMLSNGFLPSYVKLNDYNISVTFGSSVLADSVSQAYIESLGLPPHTKFHFWSDFIRSIEPWLSQAAPVFYNVSTIMLMHGPLYNNTLLYNETIVKNIQLSVLGYWYFVWPTTNPPNQIYGILWYYPQKIYSYPPFYVVVYQTAYPLIYYFPEVGHNTYVIT